MSCHQICHSFESKEILNAKKNPICKDTKEYKNMHRAQEIQNPKWPEKLWQNKSWLKPIWASISISQHQSESISINLKPKFAHTLCVNNARFRQCLVPNSLPLPQMFNSFLFLLFFLVCSALFWFFLVRIQTEKNWEKLTQTKTDDRLTGDVSDGENGNRLTHGLISIYLYEGSVSVFEAILKQAMQW